MDRADNEGQIIEYFRIKDFFQESLAAFLSEIFQLSNLSFFGFLIHFFTKIFDILK